tara:strand:- start:674 stop:1042 length:369 start_codon:yes stop_codon:yes gene_type:complete
MKEEGFKYTSTPLSDGSNGGFADEGAGKTESQSPIDAIIDGSKDVIGTGLETGTGIVTNIGEGAEGIADTALDTVGTVGGSVVEGLDAGFDEAKKFSVKDNMLPLLLIGGMVGYAAYLQFKK